MKQLILAEKPSVARDIAKVVGANIKQDGYLEGDNYIVTWALGHLVALVDPDEIDIKYKKWTWDTLPILPDNIPTKVLPKTSKQFTVIKKLMAHKNVSEIICATDAGREGELIFRLIYEKAGCKKPVKRLWISSMTNEAIKNGFSSLKPSTEYDSLYASAKCRSLSDWLVGMNASRAFTLRYNRLLSVGRVQTPTLALVVNRDLEVENFDPRDYWQITADFGDYKGLWHNEKTNEDRTYDELEAAEIKKRVKGKEATVKEAVKEQKTTPPPQLYDLTSLQRDANSKLKFSASKTLDIAQSLYETKKLITYPRTDSRYLSNDMKPEAPKVLNTVQAMFGDIVTPIFEKPLNQSKRIYDDTKLSDHHAIIPTKTNPTRVTLTPDEKAVYELVARRFIAVHYPDYVYSSSKITTVCGDDTFISKGVMPIDEGWHKVYPGQYESKDEELPKVNPGDTRVIKGVEVKKQKTKPPSRLNDASLLEQMENAGRTVDDESLKEALKASGLGTPATRAATIERLITVGYIKRSGKFLLSTDKGRALIKAAPQEITGAATTGKWERALYKMASEKDEAAAKEKTEKFMQSIKRFSEFLVHEARTNNTPVVFPQEERKYKPKTTANNKNGGKKDDA